MRATETEKRGKAPPHPSSFFPGVNPLRDFPANSVFRGPGTGENSVLPLADAFGVGAGAGVRVEPMAFLVVKDGVTRMLPVAAPALTTVDRAIELVPQVLDRVESFIDRRKEEKQFSK